MIVISFLTLTLLLALIALQALWRSLRALPYPDWTRLLLALSLSVFVYLYGAWIYISAYGKYAFALSVLGFTAFILLSRKRGKNSRSGPGPRIRDLVISAILLTTDVLYFTGTAGSTSYARLSFPLKPGRYFVLQGGKGLPANIFHYNSRRSVYAMDLVALDERGRRSSMVFSSELREYFIFGDTVYAPCDGEVERAVSDNPDNIPPRRKRGPHNLNGVLIRGAAYTVYLGHLRQAGVFVRAGQAVNAGQAIGLVGNSGMSLEPHLHIQVHANSMDGRPWYEQAQLPIRFFDKEYLLFEEIDVP